MSPQSPVLDSSLSQRYNHLSRTWVHREPQLLQITLQDPEPAAQEMELEGTQMQNICSSPLLQLGLSLQWLGTTFL